MSAIRAWRFAPHGLLERRLSAADARGHRPRPVPPRPAVGAAWVPESPLPVGLLPLPPGFELREAP